MKKEEIRSHTVYAAHGYPALNQEGLPGRFNRPIKITIVGAGSHFTALLVSDFLLMRGTQGGEIALVDIDAERLATMQQLLLKMVAQVGRAEWRITASIDRNELLRGSDYVICAIEVSGLACVQADNEIPAKYGVHQCIGDTMGPGGLFKAMRTVPIWMDILRDCETSCPQAIVLNYTNPMSALMLAAGRESSMQTIGLCHSVQGTGRLLAKRAGIPYAEMTWTCGGVNHLAWFTRLEHNGRDLYPILKEKAQNDLAGTPSNLDDAADLIRKDMMLHFGAFITESSGHLSEYLPYYRKRPDLIERYCRPGYHGETGFYVNSWPDSRASAERERNELTRSDYQFDWPRTYEYASWIIEGVEKNVPTSFHANVMNRDASGSGRLIGNLMADGCVEVECIAAQSGVRAVRFGPLPNAMAALCESNMRFFDIATDACLKRSLDLAAQALYLDPLTAAVCSLSEIKSMTRELFEAQSEFLPGFE